MQWREWSGYLVASCYDYSHEMEYHAIRSSSALIDVSPLYKYEIRGRDALKLVNRVITRDAAKADDGQVLYTPWCNEKGQVLDDGTVWRLAPDHFFWTSAEPNLRWFTLNAVGLQVEIEERSEKVAALALQGPTSKALLSSLLTEGDISNLNYYRCTTAKLGGIPVRISRTGYTGDLGYEIWSEATQAEPLWDSLIEGGRRFDLVPSGILALDLARVEAGLILIEVDYHPADKVVIESQRYTPFEIGLGWAVSLKKETFNGREALLREKRSGPKRKLVGLEISWDDLERLFAAIGLPPQLQATTWRSQIPVYCDGEQIGKATSGCWSPTLKQSIALASLKPEYAEAGTTVQIEVTVEGERKLASAQVAKLPFFDPPRKRS
jgi:aminomethyltransferase